MGIVQNQGSAELTIPQGQKIDIYCENGTAILYYSTFPEVPEIYYEHARITEGSNIFGTFLGDKKVRVEALGDDVVYKVGVNPSATEFNNLKWKEPVKVATVSSGDISTAFAAGQTVDGVSLSEGDRILLKDQADATENGIYIVNLSGEPTRSQDANVGTELVGAVVYSEQGSTNADKSFVCTNDSITIGSTSIAFSSTDSLINHNSTLAKQGGTTGEYYHLTQTAHDHAEAMDQDVATSDSVSFVKTTLTGGEIDLIDSKNSIAADQSSGTELAFKLNDQTICKMDRYSTDSCQVTPKQFSTGATAAGTPAYSFLNSPTDGMALYGTNSVSLVTDGNEALVVDSSQNVSAEANLTSKGFFGVGSPSTLTIATGEVTATKSYHQLDTEGSASTDDLDTINGGVDGRILVLRPVSNTRTIVLKDGTGNLELNGDFNMTHSRDTITLMYAGANWLELSRSDNAA